jgi:hypothetical protein
MKLKYRRTLAAAILAGVAFSASAQDAKVPMEADVHASSADACPRGTFSSLPTYKWQNGHVKHDGWLCESLYKKVD